MNFGSCGSVCDYLKKRKAVPAGAPIETEVKIRLTDPSAGKALLRRGGYRISRRRIFESNTVYDFADGRLRRGGQLLRLRQAGKVWTLTYKGPPAAGKHKSRLELESEIAKGAEVGALLGYIGLAEIFRYEKYRTEYRKGEERGLIVLDETPIGVFLELEGPPEWIDGSAKLLGLEESDYITRSYGSLYTEYCEKRGIPPGNMVFHPGERA